MCNNQRMTNERFYIWERDSTILDAEVVVSRRAFVSRLDELGIDDTSACSLIDGLDSVGYASGNCYEVATGDRAEEMRDEALAPQQKLRAWINAEKTCSSCGS